MSKVQISVSRNSSGMVGLRVVDSASHIAFLDVSMTLEAFAEIITGLSYVEAEAEFRGLDNVGKIKIVEKRRVTCPLDTYDKIELSDWLDKNCQEEGWKLDTYLGSQGSVVRTQDGETVLNYSVIKYVTEAV